MDPGRWRALRTLRLASHQATGANFGDGIWTNANFEVSLQAELQRLGGVDGISIDSVGFPNLFPNVAPNHNTLLVRRSVDLWMFGPGNLTVRYPDGSTVTIAILVATTNTPTFVAAFNTNAPPGSGLQMTASAAGQLTLTSAVPVTLGPEWFTPILNFQQDKPSTQWFGWPLNGNAWTELTVPVGFYSNIQLGDFITAFLALHYGGVWNINPTPGAQDQRFKITAPALQDISVASPYNASSYNHFDYQDLSYVMGFMFSDQGLAPAATLQASQNPNLAGEQTVYIVSQALCNQIQGFAGEGAPDFTVSCVPITAAYGDLQTAQSNYSNPNPLIVFNQPWTPIVIDISLKNIYKEQLYLPDNQQFWINIRLWYGE
jgi:hypothetical protein